MKTKTNSKKIRFLSTLAGTLLFGCIFIVNVMVFVRTGNVHGESIFTTLKAFAQSGSSGGSAHFLIIPVQLSLYYKNVQRGLVLRLWLSK